MALFPAGGLVLAGLAVSLAPVQQRSVSLPLANALVEATLAACRTQGRGAAVAVVDWGGTLIALQRAETVGPHNTRAAERKAFTALSTRTDTLALAARAANDPGSRNLTSVPELLLLGGGVPIVVDGEVIGGIGVAGSGGAASDDACARAGIAQVMARP